MKRLTFLGCLLAVCLQAGAQTSREELLSHLELTAGNYANYPVPTTLPTPAPEGYEAFYISHYGRHGSRYAWNANTYSVILECLEAAEKAGSLTPRGEKLLSDYRAFFEIPSINTGDLVELGSAQHREIARIMAQSFPEVFADGGKILARASTSQRAIVSMDAFCISLQKYAPKVDIETNSLHTNLPIVNVSGSPRELRVMRSGTVQIPEPQDAFRARKYDYDGMLDKLFTDRGFLEERGGRTQFLYELCALWSGYHNYCDGDWLEDLFTEEQALAFWEVNNYFDYVGHGGQRYQQIPLVLDIVALADEAIAGGPYRAHFRFGHDTVFNAVCPLLNIDGTGFQPDSADDVKYWFQDYDTPMAANLQFVLYRSKKNPQILFKLLRNGREVTLPQFEPVSGPYYAWDDFRAWVQQLDREHPALQSAIR